MKAYCDKCKKDVVVDIDFITMADNFGMYNVEYDEPYLKCSQCDNLIHDEDLEESLINLIITKIYSYRSEYVDESKPIN